MSTCVLPPMPECDGKTCQCYYCLIKRIEKLENSATKFIEALKVLIESNKLRTKFDSIVIEKFEMLESSHEKKPHKCPVCDGRGGTIISGVIDENCNGCKGTGIIWG